MQLSYFTPMFSGNNFVEIFFQLYEESNNQTKQTETAQKNNFR